MKSTCLSVIVLITLCCSAQLAVAENEQTWIEDGHAALAAAKKLQAINSKAKNVILFIGDGMGVSTVTGSRIFEGQRRDIDGERNQLSFEKLPYLALAKTYSANQQTPDSAPTMTAMMTGIKTNDGVLSLNQSVKRGEVDNGIIQANKIQTLLEKAEEKGLLTGVVSTARITHATPAATYAHISNRDWENNAVLPAEAVATGVKDIAVQLIEHVAKSKGLRVILGGGRTDFMPQSAKDPENPKKLGKRTDKRDLIAEYLAITNGQYVWHKQQFDAVNPKTTKHLLGLFQPSHMHYEHDRPKDKAGEPSLADMTAKAIDILSQENKGYFLMVEGARIDHASHAGNAYRTFSETAALSDAVKVAMDKVNMQDTLIIVTADHSHSLTLAGYPKRGNPILGKVIAPDEIKPMLAEDGKPYTTVTFANGLGFHEHVEEATDVQVGRIKDMSNVDTTDPDFHQEALVPLKHETHTAEDVAIYAGGPQAHLFHGVQDQSYIYYVMEEAFGF
ncbi:MAG: alkaline phosphatase [Methylophilaceae bacterium]